MKQFVIGLMLATAFVPPARASGHFFPSRPAGVATRSVTGTLVTFAHGEGLGYIVVKDDSGTEWTFSMGYPVTIDGSRASCFVAPTTSKPGVMCRDWPSGVFAGTTRVTATYWSTTFNGASVLACDQLSTTSGTRSRRRATH